MLKSMGIADISIHAPPRGATPSDLPKFTLRTISIHAPPRGATACRLPQKRLPSISIHAPPRGATPVGMAILPPKLFQFTPLREGRRRTAAQCRAPFYFNSRPSARGDNFARVCYLHKKISIHAPPRGATRGYQFREAAKIFQFTPLREGRRATSSRSWVTGTFQFTPLREGRLADCPTTRMERLFQFTPLREGRRLLDGIDCAFGDFNSRPSARGDRIARINFDYHFISIHAPPRGATASPSIRTASRRISIHAPPRGATARVAGTKREHEQFQFTPLREGRRGCPQKGAG